MSEKIHIKQHVHAYNNQSVAQKLMTSSPIHKRRELLPNYGFAQVSNWKVFNCVLRYCLVCDERSCTTLMSWWTIQPQHLRPAQTCCLNITKCVSVWSFSPNSFTSSSFFPLFSGRFCVNRRIFVVGFGLYGSIHGPTDYQVNIQVKLFCEVFAHLEILTGIMYLYLCVCSVLSISLSDHSHRQ